MKGYNKNMILRGILLLTVPFLIPSCAFEPSGPVCEGGELVGSINLSGTIEQEYNTRVNDDGFCDKDEIGVYIVDYEEDAPGVLKNSGNRADNLRHTFDEASYRWIPDHDVYWKDSKTPVDIYGYYPIASPEKVNEYLFEVMKDQSVSAAYGNMGGYEASDFLWGKVEKAAPTDRVIRLPFSHKMASVRITLQEGTGFAEGEWLAAEKAALVLNTCRTALIDLSTGVVTATGEASNTGIIPYKDAGDFRAIVVPQSVPASTPLISVTINGISYTLKKAETMLFNPSKQHNFTITVNKREAAGYEFVLTSESITAWENDNISHDATAKEYIVIHVEDPATEVAGKTEGGLKAALAAAGKDAAKVKNLKITGNINALDFYFMRDEMPALQALNLKEVKIKEVLQYGATLRPEDVIPGYAFNEHSLMKIILPESLVEIGSWAFARCKNLIGSLVIPEGVKKIEEFAFDNCENLTGTLELPSTLEYIGENAFHRTSFTCELVLPNSVKYIGDDAFGQCNNMYGPLILPERLEYLGTCAFWACDRLTGSLVIPETLTKIGEQAFYGCRSFDGNLILHDGITEIGSMAFCDCSFKGELKLPEYLQIIGNSCFCSNDFSGELVLPESLQMIGEDAFTSNTRLNGTLRIPDQVLSIGSGAFASCNGIEKLIIPKDIETIGSGAFANCFGIGSIVCHSHIPPYLGDGVFDGVPKDNFTLEVPDASIAAYQSAPGWNEFRRVAAYRNFVIRPMAASALNKSVTKRLVLTADQAWEVESKPEWISLSAPSGTGKSEIDMTFSELSSGSEPRTGEVVFKLKDQEYRTRCAVSQYDYEYEEDEAIRLLTASNGSGVNIVVLGDGYDAKDISEGMLLNDVNEAVSHFFSIEPYKTYKEHFNVYTSIVRSDESGIGGVNTVVKNRFETYSKGGSSIGPLTPDGFTSIFDYAKRTAGIGDAALANTLIIIIPNTTDYAGICYMYDAGEAIAYCPKSNDAYPYDFRGIVQHEAGGHGFGKLGDEYIYHNAFIDNCSCFCCEHSDAITVAHSKGWYQNLSLTGKMDKVPWSHFIFHPKYSNLVDIYEGGFMHTRGVFRSEQTSCMNNNIAYYSTISRESMVKRIMAISGVPYSFDDFVAKDVLDASTPTQTKSADDNYVVRRGEHHSPVMMGNRK